MKKKVLISSVLTIALCLSLIVGSTFALFTSTSTVNVAVTSGKVNVVASIRNLALGSTLEKGNLPQTSVSNKDNTITLDKIVPGDYVDFDIVITNNSDVSIQYRTIIKMVTDNGLWDGLVVTIGDAIYSGTNSKVAPWAALEPNSDDIIVHVNIALPEKAGNEYQEKSCTLAYTVEAIQGNAEIVDVADAEALKNAVTSGKDASLTADIALESNLTLKDGVTIYGNGHTISGASVWSGDNCTFENIVFTAPENASNNASCLYASGKSIIIDGCTFKDTQWDAVQIAPNEGDTVVINNCTFIQENGNAQRFIHIEANPNYVENDVKIVLTNNHFGNDSLLTNATIDLDWVKLDSIDFGGNNTFANVPMDIYVIGEKANGRSITSAEAFERMGAVAVSNAEELASLKGVTKVILTNDITITGQWTPISYLNGNIYNPQYNGKVVIDGNGHSISGLTAPLLQDNFCTDLTVKNLTIKDSVISGGLSNGKGALIGYLNTFDLTIDNCHLDNVTVNGINGGLQCGGFVGLYTCGNLSVTGCTVKNSTINADSSAGAIAGQIQTASGKTTNIEGCTVENCNINSSDDGDWRIGAIVGTVNGDGEFTTIDNCTESGNTYSMPNSTVAVNPNHPLYGRDKRI